MPVYMKVVIQVIKAVTSVLPYIQILFSVDGEVFLVYFFSSDILAGKFYLTTTK